MPRARASHPPPSASTGGLVDAAKTHGLAEGTILCDTEHGTLTRDGVRIRILPVWYFALSPSHD